MIIRCSRGILLCLLFASAMTSPPEDLLLEDADELTTLMSPTTGRPFEVPTPVALVLVQRTGLVEAGDQKSGSTTNHLNKNLPNTTKNVTARPIPSSSTTEKPIEIPTTVTTTTTTVEPTPSQSMPEVKIEIEPRRVPFRGQHVHSCPRAEDIHPCECLEIKNHYNDSQLETVAFCKSIRNADVLKDAMKGMQGHFINYFVMDSCKLPPFPNGLFHNMGIGWMEVLNSTVQFQESFFTCSNGCW